MQARDILYNSNNLIIIIEKYSMKRTVEQKIIRLPGIPRQLPFSFRPPNFASLLPSITANARNAFLIKNKFDISPKQVLPRIVNQHGLWVPCEFRVRFMRYRSHRHSKLLLRLLHKKYIRCWARLATHRDWELGNCETARLLSYRIFYTTFVFVQHMFWIKNKSVNNWKIVWTGEACCLRSNISFFFFPYLF